MGSEPRRLPFVSLTEVVPENCEAVSGMGGKTETYLIQFPKLAKMDQFTAFQNPVSEETTLKAPNMVEKEIQNWVNVSLLKKRGDPDWERSSEILSKQDISTKEELSMQPVTMKFLINDKRTFTHAFGIHTHMQDIKETLSRTFECQSDDLQLSVDGISLSDSLEVSELGVQPYGTVEIEIKAKGFLKTESIYEVPVVPDIITVRVESGTCILYLHVKCVIFIFSL
jgi:hypothetical protein